MSKGLGLSGDWPKEASGITPDEAREEVNKLFMHLSGPKGQRWLHCLKQFNRGENPFGRLRFVGTISISACSEKLNPDAFFKTRDGLYVVNTFKDRILPVVSSMESIPEATLTVFNLEKSLTDHEIKTELGDGYVFENTSMFCAQFAEMLNRQKDGEKDEGALLVNGLANVFYVRGIDDGVFAVHVFWNDDNREWSVRANRFDNYRWPIGRRFFSNNDLPIDLLAKTAA
ncbi:hypothetical protein CL630_01225 [bacterium]|nr:hypothetical protein [bacterium]|tara:strand:+ start:641 stop:1327 length:687 start_codon:yes stop_codon:yes gene_type:complete